MSSIRETTPIEFALRALEVLAPLDESDRELALGALGGETKPHRVGADLGDSGDHRCWILIRGWACRARVLPDGRRQIFNFLMPGDIVGLRRLDQPQGLYRIVALTVGATLDAGAIKDRVRRGEPSTLMHASMQFERSQTASLFDHITRLGARTAYEATANLLLDLYHRSEALERCTDGRFALPLSQAVLSDALGVSPIQINRILARLRKEGLMALGSGWVEIPDPAALAAVARTARFS